MEIFMSLKEEEKQLIIKNFSSVGADKINFFKDYVSITINGKEYKFSNEAIKIQKKLKKQ
jgi:hypothetical protein